MIWLDRTIVIVAGQHGNLTVGFERNMYLTIQYCLVAFSFLGKALQFLVPALAER
jgi:hypothetical protein